jgi:hypothetical protein
MRSTYDRSRVMRTAHAEWRYARMRGWHIGADPVTFAACLRFAPVQEKARG